MKKMIFGILVASIGLIYSAFCFVYVAMNPWNYNGIDGLLGSFLGTKMLIPFIIAVIVMCVGVAICAFEAYRKDE